VLIIAVLQTGLAQVGATEPTKRLFTGGVIIFAVVADVRRRRWTKALARAWKRVITSISRRS
jgi:ribose transport system permease protein